MYVCVWQTWISNKLVSDTEPRPSGEPIAGKWYEHLIGGDEERLGAGVSAAERPQGEPTHIRSHVEADGV